MSDNAPTNTPASDAFDSLLHTAVRGGQQIAHYVQTQPILQLAVGSVALVVLGGMVRRQLPLFGGFLRFFGNLGLIGAMLLLILQVAHIGIPGLDTDFRFLSGDDQTVTGSETRIPLARDGHYWVRARVNGTAHRFLVDTGATITTLAPDTADDADVKPKRWGEKVEMTTANGPTTADMAVIGELRVGNVVARNIDAVVAPGIGETNVLGMNFLSRLASWRVEDRTLILVPHHPMKEEDPAQDTEQDKGNS